MVKVERLLIGRYAGEPYVTIKKAQYLLRFSGVIMLTCVIGMLFRSSVGESVFYTVAFACFVFVVLCLKRGNLGQAVWVTTVAMSVCILIDTLQFHPLTYERIVETIMECFLAYIVIGLVAVERRQVIFTIAANTALTLLHAVLIVHFGYAHQPLPSAASRYFVGGVVSVFLVGMLTLAMVKIHEEALTVVERQKEFLSENNQQLEKLVSSRTSELEVAYQKLERANQELFSLAMQDQLTGIPNRRRVLEEAKRIFDENTASGAPMAVAMLDLDNFKQVNDRYGHVVGDMTLKSFVDVLKQAIRTSDIVGRLGGDEFLVIFENTPREKALELAAQIQSSVQHQLLAISEDEFLSFTVSIGIAERRPGSSLEQMIHEADMSLYRSKQNGRNCLTLYTEYLSAQ